MIQHVKSADGTLLAVESFGDGEPLIVLGGALSTRAAVQQYVPFLATDFSVIGVDRRGRGDSGDTPPYAVEREVEDVAAIVRAVGGSAKVYGHSSGAILALEAAAAGVPISSLLAYEPPFCTPQEPGESWDQFAARVRQLAETGRRDEAVEAFLRHAGVPVEAVKQSPWWPGMTALAHTLFYDLTLAGNADIPAERLAKIQAPVLAVYGGNSDSWAQNSAEGVVSAVQNGRTALVPGYDHMVAPEALTPILLDFFAAASG
ncbi:MULTISPECIES: alpha/beta hydrolase [unclassified Arthrobacter]|uniref:alpha/beta fold hydrolase n=1 Tax=unclassified Arthrobacter TaxID=235627 RepID=UPI003393F88B